jgi:hypothetical protein
MSDFEKKIKKIEMITFVMIGVFMITAVFLEANNFTDLGVEFAFFINGVILITCGVFGLINHEISIGNATALKYNKNSLVGKIANVIIGIMGVSSIVIGIMAFIS